jgi:hypothetical protein
MVVKGNWLTISSSRPTSAALDFVLDSTKSSHATAVGLTKH